MTVSVASLVATDPSIRFSPFGAMILSCNALMLLLSNDACIQLELHHSKASDPDKLFSHYFQLDMQCNYPCTIA